MSLQSVIQFPPQALVNRNIPKNKIYEQGSASAAVKRKFIEQIEQIRWTYKLAPESINLPAKGFVQEIQVFELRLKDNIENIDEAILKTLDKAISHPILHCISKAEHICYAMAYKRAHESDASKWLVDDYFYSSWIKANKQVTHLPTALNLQILYQNLLRQLMPEPLAPNETLPKQISRLQHIAQLQKQVQQLENTLRKEKQFNRKVEINAQLRTLKQQLKTLSP